MAKQATVQQATPDSGRTFKSATGSDSNVRFVRPSKLNEDGFTGVVVEGLYQGSVPNKFDEKKSDYKILADDGTLTIVNGGGNLGWQMKEIEAGNAVRITYNGMKTIAKGKMAGKDSHDFKVEIEA